MRTMRRFSPMSPPLMYRWKSTNQLVTDVVSRANFNNKERNKQMATKIITDLHLFAIGDQWGAEVEYPNGATEPIWAVNGNEGTPDWERDEKSYEEWYNRALDEAHKQGFKLEGEL
jgi:hypothetical protein